MTKQTASNPNANTTLLQSHWGAVTPGLEALSSAGGFPLRAYCSCMHSLLRLLLTLHDLISYQL